MVLLFTRIQLIGSSPRSLLGDSADQLEHGIGQVRALRQHSFQMRSGYQTAPVHLTNQRRLVPRQSPGRGADIGCGYLSSANVRPVEDFGDRFIQGHTLQHQRV